MIGLDIDALKWPVELVRPDTVFVVPLPPKMTLSPDIGKLRSPSVSTVSAVKALPDCTVVLFKVGAERPVACFCTLTRKAELVAFAVPLPSISVAITWFGLVLIAEAL